MIKQLILLIQVFGLFFYQLIFAGDLTVTQKVSDSISQGETGVVEITINKSDITGFAKIQQICPEGFSAEVIDSKGATFSFKENKIKFIWMVLPSEKEFTISYRITPKENVAGDFTLGGKFSYLLDGETKNIEIAVANFKVIGENVIVEEQGNSDSVKETSGKIDVKCVRTIKTLGNGRYKVVVEIDKKGIQGFAKITEKIPAGFTASEDNSNGGIFSFKANDAKILWMKIPENDIYIVSYNIAANAATDNGTFNISGFYSYLDNDITSKYDLELSSFELNIEQLLVEESEMTDPVVEDVSDLKKYKSTVVSILKPENGVSYKVQIAAGHKTVASNYFATKFKLKDDVSTINHEGWIKYLVGTYSEYTAARDKRNLVRRNVMTSFVTAYNSGKRITVQEALMISNQKWYN